MKKVEIAFYLVPTFILYAVSYLLVRSLESSAYAAWLNTCSQVILNLFILFFLIRAYKGLKGIERVYLLFMIIASISSLFTDAFYGYFVNVVSIDTNKDARAIFYNFFYVISMLSWSFSWFFLLNVFKIKDRLDSPIILSSIIVLGGLCALFLISYIPLLESSIGYTTIGNFHLVLTIFQIIGLFLAILCLFCSPPNYIIFIVIGYCTLVTTDFVLRGYEIASALEPVEFFEVSWSLGLMFILYGSIKMTNHVKFKESLSNTNNALIVYRSKITGILSICILGPMLIVTVIMTNVEILSYKVAFSVNFIILFTIAGTYVAKKFEHAFDTFQELIQKLFIDEITSEPKGSVKYIWQLTNLNVVLNDLKSGTSTWKKQHIKVGPEFFFPLDSNQKLDANQIQCFVIMPYGPPWSKNVYSAIKNSLTDRQCACIRSDEIYGVKDVVIEMWHSMRESDFLIADISERNPNVLYEVGIGHTLGKPTLLLCQNSDDIPFDLATKRVLIYDKNDLIGLKEKLINSIEEIMKLFKQND